VSVLHAVIVANCLVIAFNCIGIVISPKSGPPPIWCYCVGWIAIVGTLVVAT
jgi:hypothetical protein